MTITEPEVQTSLLGASCPGCATTTYPATGACPRCGAAMRDVTLSGQGTLWSWTVQRFPPKSPPYEVPVDWFKPFVVGYVELAEGVRVGAVVDVPVDEVSIGMELSLWCDGGVPQAGRLT